MTTAEGMAKVLFAQLNCTCESHPSQGTARHCKDWRWREANRIADALAAAGYGDIEADRKARDGAINWDTTCLNCAKLLDSCYAETMRAEKAEEEREEIRATLRAETRISGKWRQRAETAESTLAGLRRAQAETVARYQQAESALAAQQAAVLGLAESLEHGESQYQWIADSLRAALSDTAGLDKALAEAEQRDAASVGRLDVLRAIRATASANRLAGESE